MEVIKLGKKGQVSIPKAILKRLGLDGETMLLVETTADGGILLRPAGVYPIEMYTKERIEEFLEGDRLTSQEAEQLQQLRDVE
ncbi:AbrB/MazE/SpoVT family DNA-binding domain-containing protein [Tolypothrix campylonemoides VB511288]|nr:AbrB/MazE/SpoVT family DNA-binding domain-containing protein [Tolypothrix campylonemoides VB511288]